MFVNYFRIKGSENFQTVGPEVLKKQTEHVLSPLLEPLQARLSLMAEQCEKSVLKRVAKVTVYRTKRFCLLSIISSQAFISFLGTLEESVKDI